MGADNTLVQGAYKAASAGADAVKNIGQVGQDLMNQATKFTEGLASNAGEYNKYVQDILASNGELPADEYEALYDKLMEGRDAYIMGGSKDKALAIRDLNQKAGEFADYKDFRTDLAAAIDAGTLRNGWDQTPEGQALMALLQDEARLVEYECEEGVEKCPDQGKMGVMMPDPDATAKLAEANAAMDVLDSKIQAIYQRADYDAFGEPVFVGGDEAELQQLLAEVAEHEKTIKDGDMKFVGVNELKKKVGYKDTISKDVLTSQANNYLSMSASLDAGSTVEFNREAADHLVRTNIIDKGDLLSLAYDEHISGRTFADDLADSIFGKKWGELGVTDEDLKLYIEDSGPIDGVDDDDVITEEERVLIQQHYDEQQQEAADREGQVNEYISVYDVYNNQGELVNADGEIDEVEAALIAKSMIENPDYRDIFKKELTQYYSNYMENQWNIGKNSRAKKKETKTTENDQSYNT